MAPPRRPQRRLPARVYWFRRALVAASVLGIIVAFAHLIGGSGGAAPQADQVSNKTSGTPSPSPTTSAQVGPVGAAGAGSPTATGSAPAADLPQPDGACSLDEITVTPVASTFPAGSTVPIGLQLTGIRPACTLAVSPKTLVVKVTTADKIWSSQDCPTSIPTTSVVVRSGTPATIQVRWSGRTSDPTCSAADPWVLPGTFHVMAAVIGSEPSQADIKLTAPPRPVVTKTVHPKPSKTPTNLAITTKSPSKSPTH
jgi:hypothetical protein